MTEFFCFLRLHRLVKFQRCHSIWMSFNELTSTITHIVCRSWWKVVNKEVLPVSFGALLDGNWPLLCTTAGPDSRTSCQGLCLTNCAWVISLQPYWISCTCQNIIVNWSKHYIKYHPTAKNSLQSCQIFVWKQSYHILIFFDLGKKFFLCKLQKNIFK